MRESLTSGIWPRGKEQLDEGEGKKRAAERKTLLTCHENTLLLFYKGESKTTSFLSKTNMCWSSKQSIGRSESEKEKKNPIREGRCKYKFERKKKVAPRKAQGLQELKIKGKCLRKEKEKATRRRERWQSRNLRRAHLLLLLFKSLLEWG